MGTSFTTWGLAFTSVLTPNELSLLVTILIPLKSVIFFGGIQTGDRVLKRRQGFLSEKHSFELFGGLKQIAMEDWNGIKHIINKRGGVGGRSMRDNEDFEEEDVWGFVKESDKDSSSPVMRKSKEYSSGSSSSSSAWCIHSSPRMIPRVLNAPTTHEAQAVQQSSAPVDIPDWSKIYGKNAKIGPWVGDDDHGNGINTDGVVYDDVNEDVEDDDGDDMVPPHEWIARKLARSQISSFSVCEGIGRTLKGRDLSKMRNAILTKTGFLE
ncbi:hypothetical protein FNV43_RR07821 [Rhamnella rubrinervis]|uniref:Uncharacterized protein n=1 Tax=Rhamnella rubrinervis TaxID=2594499 RepID=A0A8K0HHA1_9ROSA|nr:hypothetical protein FNV43_RR07821 [Rhamnella rubrinervis]